MFILTTIPGYSLERNCFIINMRTCVWMGVRMFVSNISFRLFECCVTSVKKSLKGMATFCWSNNVIYTTPSADWRLVDLERQCLEYVTIPLLTTLNSTSKQQHPKVWHMKSKKKKRVFNLKRIKTATANRSNERFWVKHARQARVTEWIHIPFNH